MDLALLVTPTDPATAAAATDLAPATVELATERDMALIPAMDLATATSFRTMNMETPKAIVS